LEEKDFVRNFEAVFGFDCPYFGKLLYLFMSEGYDRKKISLLRFIESIFPLFDSENRLFHNKVAFQIYDFDRDKILNILNILDLEKNINSQTKLGQEVFKILDFQIKNNLHSKRSQKEKINYDIFCKIVGRSCIIKEICDVMFCLDMEQASNDPDYKRESIFEVRKDMSPGFDHTYFNNNDIIVSDVSFGQRNYKRNLDAILGVLIKGKHRETKKKYSEGQE
jgi:hypothetical protein